jgi:hypothetical protein
MRRIFVHTTFFVFSLPRRSSNYIRVRMLRQHLNFTKRVEGKFERTKIMIFAIFPRPGIWESVNRVTNQFLENGYAVICVVNNPNFDILDSIHSRNPHLTILSRNNIGRDFGAYQLGLKYLRDSKVSPEYLFLVNDSVYYFPKTNFELIRNEYQRGRNWISYFSNFQYHFHAQTFFVGFSSEILQKKAFIKFWERYYPSNERRPAINNGEVELSKRLLQSGFTPHAFVNPESLAKNLKQNQLTISEKRILYEIHFTNNGQNHLNKISSSDLQKDAQWILQTKNPTHLLGIYCARTMGTPLKLDVIRNGVCTVADVLEHANKLGLKNSELPFLQISILGNKTVATRQGIEQYWIAHGLV